MFTGLIQQTGRIASLEKRGGAMRIRISAPGLASRLREGDSVAVSGVCLTALSPTADTFEADLAQETISRSSLSQLAPHHVVNLELPLPAGTPLGGHIVQGHVDGTGRLISIRPATPGSEDRWLEIDIPDALTRYVVDKGSIALEGISLTVASSFARRTDQFDAEMRSSTPLRRSQLEEFVRSSRDASQQLVGNLHRAAELIQSFKQVAVDRSHAERRQFSLSEATDQIIAEIDQSLATKEREIMTV